MAALQALTKATAAAAPQTDAAAGLLGRRPPQLLDECVSFGLGFSGARQTMGKAVYMTRRCSNFDLSFTLEIVRMIRKRGLSISHMSQAIDGNWGQELGLGLTLRHVLNASRQTKTEVVWMSDLALPLLTLRLLTLHLRCIGKEMSSVEYEKQYFNGSRVSRKAVAIQYASDEDYHVSHETIYRSLYIQARGALK